NVSPGRWVFRSFLTEPWEQHLGSLNLHGSCLKRPAPPGSLRRQTKHTGACQAGPPASFALCAAESEFDDVLKAAGSKLVVVDFSAKWCGPCKAISPVIHDLAVRYDNVMFCSVDIDRAEDVANSCKIVAMPTFQMFKKMEKIFEITGTDIRKLETKIEELM
uniref:Thioredoxin domain containing 8 n=1 Tax=Chelydra serpentina TaxID=8475 RepID=A0A8C3S2E9_CHESE